MRRLAVFCLLIVAVLLRAEGFPELGPGLTYTLTRDGVGPWATCVLKIDRARPEYTFTTTLAKGTIFGLATVPEQAKAVPAALGTPVAAINGDWFTLPAGPYQGDLLNLCIHHGELVSLASWGDTVWLDAEGQPHLAHVTSDLRVTWPDGTTQPLALDGPRADDGAALYTPIFGPSTHTKGGRELVLGRAGDAPWLPLRVGQPVKAVVREVREVGDTALAPDIAVLSLGPAAKAPAVKPGDTLTLAATTTPDLTDVPLAFGAGQTLLAGGKLPNFGKGEQPRHPRSALGWNADAFFLIVVDGRRAGWSVGMTIPELAAFAKTLGCTEAINLDGGGSSTLWLKDGVMNLPSDGAPRPVANALVLVRRKGK
jgi:hypothetical protein